jgi:hypothetical protein
MRAAVFLFLFAAWGLVSLPVACSSGTSPSPVQGDGGFPGDGGVQPPPPHWACSGSQGTCLSGTVSTSSFSAKPQVILASLYKVFPESVATMPLETQTVATDGTWAFSNEPSWGHYYVQLVAGFGQMYGPGATVGPLSVPSSGPVDVQVRPVQIVALQQTQPPAPDAGTGGSFGLAWASAHAFDPSSGDELPKNAVSVSIQVGGTSTSLSWTSNGGDGSYFLQFSPPLPAAQSSYTITTSGAAFGAMPASWQVIAAPPTFMPSITTTQATMSGQNVLTVSWAPQPPVDYVTVAVFRAAGGALVASTSTPVAPDQTPPSTQLTLPASDGGATSYVVDAYFTTASCPTTADGCVLASAVAAAQITAQ